MDWVAKVMAGVAKSPFSRIKSTAANITADEARARGYVKGAQKSNRSYYSSKENNYTNYCV